jgi:hypothetical protein
VIDAAAIAPSPSTDAFHEGERMHTYALRAIPGDPVPDITTFRFRDALDVVAYAERDRTIGWATWPDVWHLDDEGRFHCYFKGSSLDSLERWAHDPTPLLTSRACGVSSRDGCRDRWVVVDSKPSWLHDQPTVSEATVAAFLVVRDHLRPVGVTLLDAVIFDDVRHWWSINEVITGATAWRGDAPVS